MIELFDIISNATVALSALLAVIIILKFNNLSSILKVVGIYIIVSASIDIISTAYFYISESNIVFLHLFTLFEITILSHLFTLLFDSLKSKVNILFISIPAIALVILNTLFVESIYQFNTYSSMLVSAVILGFCIHFFTLIIDFKAPNYQFKILKWFIYTLFIYHSVSLIFMLFSSLLPEISMHSQSYIWIFRSIIIMITKILLIMAFGSLFQKNRKSIVHE